MENFYEANKEIIDSYLKKIENTDPYNKTVLDLAKECFEYVQRTENRKPFFDELIRYTMTTKERLTRVLEENGLLDEIDTSFKSKLAKDIYDTFPGAELNVSGIVSNYVIELLYRDYNIGINVVLSYENDVSRVGKKHAQMLTINANKSGIRLINIFDYELLDAEVKSRVYRMLEDILNEPDVIAGARHTKVRPIDYADARDFLNIYHIQGTATANVYLGSYYKDELVGVMTFGKPRFSKGYDYEIVRLAWKKGVRISGGTKKMFSYFVKNYKPESIMTYADINKFTGNSYIKLGYKFMQVTDPDYKWVSVDSAEALTRYKCQKHRLIQKGWGTVEQTEDQIMVAHGYYKVFGSGNIMLDWIKDRKPSASTEVKITVPEVKTSITPTKKSKPSSVSSLSKFI